MHLFKALSVLGYTWVVEDLYLIYETITFFITIFCNYINLVLHHCFVKVHRNHWPFTWYMVCYYMSCLYRQRNVKDWIHNVKDE